MIQFSNCKINLGLHIVSKRADGFHNLETCFYPIPFYDVLEIIESKTFKFTNTGLHINVNQENNLCVKAYNLLKNDFTELPLVHLHLQKNIPMGAGIGGGSANATNTLLLLNKKFNLKISTAKLQEYALELGSDCPYFLHNTACIAKGRGEELEPIDFNLNNFTIIILFPKVHINTKEAFSKIKPKIPNFSIKEIINTPLENWKTNLINDFEEPIFEQHKILAKYKNTLYDLGAIYSSMSGSGSSIYGIFNKNSISKNEILTCFKDIDFKII